MATLTQVQEIMDDRVYRLCDPAAGVDEPWGLVEYMVFAALKQFATTIGRKPKLLHMPAAMEAAIQISRARCSGEHEKTAGKLRDRDPLKLFGCRVLWDARSFRIE